MIYRYFSNHMLKIAFFIGFEYLFITHFHVFYGLAFSLIPTNIVGTRKLRLRSLDSYFMRAQGYHYHLTPLFLIKISHLHQKHAIRSLARLEMKSLHLFNIHPILHLLPKRIQSIGLLLLQSSLVVQQL